MIQNRIKSEKEKGEDHGAVAPAGLDRDKLKHRGLAGRYGRTELPRSANRQKE